MDLGHKIKSAREKSGISLRKLAELSGIAPSHLSYIESNKTNPTVDKLTSICNALNISLYEILSDSDIVPIALSPELRNLIENAKNLTSEQLEQLSKFLKTMN